MPWQSFWGHLRTFLQNQFHGMRRKNLLGVGDLTFKERKNSTLNGQCPEEDSDNAGHICGVIVDDSPLADKGIVQLSTVRTRIYLKSQIYRN
jgi:hypothetical protein